MKPIKIGITGGIASGKSTVVSFLKKRYKVIEADLIAKDLMKIGNINYKNIVDEFSCNILLANGEIDKKKLGEIIFNDANKRELLNNITHKNIFDKMKEEILKSEEICFVDIPLLFESKKEGLYIDFDEIWLVSVDRKVQIERLMKRDNISKEYAKNKIDSQMDLNEKIRLSDRVIPNNGSINELSFFLEKNIENWIIEIEKKKSKQN